LHRVGAKLDRTVCTGLQTRDDAPARIVSVGMIEPEMRAAAFRARERGSCKDASEEREIAHGERAFELVATHLARSARRRIKPHGRHILARDALIFAQRLLERSLMPDGAEL